MIQINLEKKYIQIMLVVLVFLLGAGLTIAWNSGDPQKMGHSTNELERCPDGQILKVSGGNWVCSSDATGGGSSLPTCVNNQVIKYSTSSSSWICSNDINTDTKCNALGICTKVYGGELCIGGSCRNSWSTAAKTFVMCSPPRDRYTNGDCSCGSATQLARISGKCKVSSDTGSCDSGDCYVGATVDSCGACCVCQP